jgi:hypothetical protein
MGTPSTRAKKKATFFHTEADFNFLETSACTTAPLAVLSLSAQTIQVSFIPIALNKNVCGGG